MTNYFHDSKQFHQKLKTFTENVILPQNEYYVHAGGFPNDLFLQIGSAGFLDMTLLSQRPNAKHNGIESAMIFQEIARSFPSMALSMSPHISCMNLIAEYGTAELKRDILPAALQGKLLLGFALTESLGGSDALAIRTIATAVENGWVLNGEKCWITNAGAAKGYIVAARSSAGSRSRDISLYYVSADTPGLDDSESISLNGMANSPTGTIKFHNCRISSDCLIGIENDGYRLIRILLNEGRLTMAAIGVGIAQGAMDCAVRFTGKSRQNEVPLSSYQGVSFTVARMYEKIFLARTTLFYLANQFAIQRCAAEEVAALKLFASEMCCEVCRNAVQLHGASGLEHGSTVERYFQDAQMLTIGEGTSEICQLIISGKIYHSIHQDKN